MVRAVVLVSIVVGAAALLLIFWRGRAPLPILRRSPLDAAAGAGPAPAAPCTVMTPPASAAPGAPVAARAPGAAIPYGAPASTAGIRPLPARPPKRNNGPSHFAGPMANAARRTRTQP